MYQTLVADILPFLHHCSTVEEVYQAMILASGLACLMSHREAFFKASNTVKRADEEKTPIFRAILKLQFSTILNHQQCTLVPLGNRLVIRTSVSRW